MPVIGETLVQLGKAEPYRHHRVAGDHAGNRDHLHRYKGDGAAQHQNSQRQASADADRRQRNPEGVADSFAALTRVQRRVDADKQHHQQRQPAVIKIKQVVQYVTDEGELHHRAGDAPQNILVQPQLLFLADEQRHQHQQAGERQRGIIDRGMVHCAASVFNPREITRAPSAVSCAS